MNDFSNRKINEEFDMNPQQNLPLPMVDQHISMPIIEEKKYSFLEDPAIEKINFYIIGLKTDMKKYFELLKENFKFIKEIETDYRDLKEKLNSQKLIRPCLAITFSPEYAAGRINQDWEQITKLIMEQTGFLNF